MRDSYLEAKWLVGIDYAFSSGTGSYAWRIPVILQCIFLVPMLVITTFLIPESPRWLAAHERPEESLVILRRLKGHSLDDAAILRLHQDILHAVVLETSLGAGSWKHLLRSDRIKSRRRLLIACGIQAFQQLGGINAIICRCQFNKFRLKVDNIVDYSGTLFQKSVGFDAHMSALMSGFLQSE